MNTPDRIMWFKGQLTPANQALVPVLSPTSQFGLNVFEGLRGYWDGQQIHVFRFDDHFTRLEHSCRLIGIDLPYGRAQTIQALRDVTVANSYACDVALRATVFVDGEGTWSSSGPVDMFVAPIAKGRTELTADTRTTACISTWTRIHDSTLPPRVKLGANYLNGRYAHLEARRNGYDLPILLDRDGTVAEGAGACLFLRRGETLITPGLTSSILESITRDTLITLARDLGMTVEARSVDRTELYVADELFFCGSAAEVTPLTKIDGFTVGTGAPGRVTLDLHEAYLKVADGRDTRWPDWRLPLLTTD